MAGWKNSRSLWQDHQGGELSTPEAASVCSARSLARVRRLASLFLSSIDTTPSLNLTPLQFRLQTTIHIRERANSIGNASNYVLKISAVLAGWACAGRYWVNVQRSVMANPSKDRKLPRPDGTQRREPHPVITTTLHHPYRSILTVP